MKGTFGSGVVLGVPGGAPRGVGGAGGDPFALASLAASVAIRLAIADAAAAVAAAAVAAVAVFAIFLTSRSFAAEWTKRSFHNEKQCRMWVSIAASDSMRGESSGFARVAYTSTPTIAKRGSAFQGWIVSRLGMAQRGAVNSDKGVTDSKGNDNILVG